MSLILRGLARVKLAALAGTVVFNQLKRWIWAGAWDIFIDQDFHPLDICHIDGSYLFFRKIGGVFQTCQDVFSRQGGILAQKVFHAVAIGQHADQLMNRNSRALHAGLAVADIRIN
jgi:hypothetical protein